MSHTQTKEKDWSNDISNNMDEVQKHAEWKKSNTKGHILYDAIYMKYPE